MTESSPGVIVSYRTPPITEVVVAASFKPLAPLNSARLGSFWSASLKNAFPTIEERPRYEPPIERYDEDRTRNVPKFTIATGAPPSRLWCISPDGTELLQLQNDWFAANWRKVKPTDKYDRWSSREDAFRTWFRSFEQFVSDEADLGPIELTQCEVTYIDHVVPGSAWTSHADLPNLLNIVSTATRSDLPPPEEMNVGLSYLIPDDDGQPIGRLRITAQPAFQQKDGLPIFVLNLTARGRPADSSLESAIEFMRLARSWIDDSFVAITTEAADEQWGRE